MEQAWIFHRLAVTLARIDFIDPALADRDDVRERGIRLEVRLGEASTAGSIYASPQVRLAPAVCRIDLLESAPRAADRMHWHPVMAAGEPGDRVFDAAMVDDPLDWLERRLRDLETLLARSGVSVDGPVAADCRDVRGVVADIRAAAERGLEWARADPWPAVERDARGLASNL